VTDSILPTLLTPEEAALAIGVTPGTLAIWRCTRRYRLSWIKVGRKVRYRQDDIEIFLNSRRVEAVVPDRIADPR
jgi:hypothetical protein